VQVENDEEADLVSSFSIPRMEVVMATRVLTFVIGLMFLMMLKNCFENPFFKVFSENPLLCKMLFLTESFILNLNF